MVSVVMAWPPQGLGQGAQQKMMTAAAAAAAAGRGEAALPSERWLVSVSARLPPARLRVPTLIHYYPCGRPRDTAGQSPPTSTPSKSCGHCDCDADPERARPTVPSESSPALCDLACTSNPCLAQARLSCYAQSISPPMQPTYFCMHKAKTSFTRRLQCYKSIYSDPTAMLEALVNSLPPTAARSTRTPDHATSALPSAK